MHPQHHHSQPLKIAGVKGLGLGLGFKISGSVRQLHP